MVHTPVKLPLDKLAAFCRRWQITELALFGSAGRNDFHPDSDVDFLVTFAAETRWSLFDLVTMQAELQGIVGREVDMVERRAVEKSENYIRRRHILQSAEPIYVAG
jgi:predicted nucleotidyltransferase